MKWRHLFSKYIIDRGRSYYDQERVQNLSCKDGIYQAKVLGTRFYTVKIKTKDDKVLKLSCTCPHAKGGSRCKHMAAVFFEIENNEQYGQLELLSSASDKTMVRPFKPVTDRYQFFDIGNLLNDLEVSASLYAKAKQLIAKEQVVLESVKVGYNRMVSDALPCCVALGAYSDKTNTYPLTIILTRDSILRAVCSAPRCGHYWGKDYYRNTPSVCHHLLAILMLLDEHLKKHNPGDTTDTNGIYLLSGFRSQSRHSSQSASDETNDLVIEPVLEKGTDALYLSLKAGTNKLYVVKNMPDFFTLYKNKETITFGQKTEVDLAKHRVCDDSLALYDYVQQALKDLEMRNQYLRTVTHYYSDEEVKNKLPLYGERLDRFYDLYKGKEINCSDKSDYRTEKILLKLQDGKPDLSLTIKPDTDNEQVFHGVCVSGEMPDFISGQKYRYFFDEKHLYRIPPEVFQNIEPLLELSDGSYGRALSFHVGRKSLSEFYHKVLPVLEKNVSVEETQPELTQQYIPPEAIFRFYLDTENEKLICRPRALYSETEVSLLDLLRDDVRYEDFRNSLEESDVLLEAQKFFPEPDLELDELYCEETEDALINLMENGIDRLMDIGEVHTTDRFRSINIRRKPNLKVGVSLESDLMNLSISSDDLTPEELVQILQSYQRKKKYYRLKSGSLVEIEEKDIEALQQMMSTLNLSAKDLLKGNMKVPMYRALYLNKLLEQNESIYLNRDKHFKKLIREFKTTEDSSFEVPESLSPLLRNYQTVGFQWMRTLSQYGFGGILADDMGLGKTLQMISVLLDAKERGESGTSLIVCPASLVYNWAEEFAKFAPDINISMVVGSQPERAALISDCGQYDVLITSYDLLKRDIAEYEDKIFLYQVLDEAQYIKNHSTAAAKSAKVIRSKYHFALTGTPIENRLSELWSIFDYLMPGFLYNYETFRKELETPIVKHKDEQASERLRKMISPFILRRLKKDVLKDLPDKIEEIRYTKLDGEQLRLYDGQVVHMKKLLQEQDAEAFQNSKLQILAELTKIRQLCCDPELLFEKYHGGSAKRAACIELIQSAIEGEHKILVFSQFTSMLSLLEKDLNNEKIAYYKITGDTPKQQRLEMVKSFNQDQTPVFLISLKAGGTGLNLTGADVVIHYDPWWNLAAQNQATDRAHRIGQEKIVSVYKLIAKDTVEEKILKMQESKRDLADRMLSGEVGGIAQLSKDELMALL